MRQPDNLPAFCRVHRNGRPLIGMSAPPRRSGLRSALSQIGPFCSAQGAGHASLTAVHNGGSVCGYQPGFAWLVALIATAGR